MSFSEELSTKLKAGYPILYVETHEEARALAEVRHVAEEQAREVWRWSSATGWHGEGKALDAPDPLTALGMIESLPDSALCVLLDFHFFLDSPDIIRKVRDSLDIYKAGRPLIIVACRTAIPPELSKEVTTLPFALPTLDELGEVLDRITKIVQEKYGAERAHVEDRRALLEACRGLTISEAENALTLAVVRGKGFNGTAVKIVQTEKASVVKRSGTLEYHEPSTSLADVGGLDAVKTWFLQRKNAWTDEAREYGIPLPRGCLVVGMPGCGKSLLCKSVASSLGLVLIRLDMGRVYGQGQGLVGGAERELDAVEGMKRRGLVLSYLMKFKQLCNHPDHYAGSGSYLEKESGKFLRLRELCDTIGEKRERVLVFTQFSEIIPALDRFLSSVFGRHGVTLHGGTPVARRREIVAEFQSADYVPYFILSVKAGGTGLNLTAARHVIHFDRWWNPAVEKQAEDRAYRIGQTHRVMVHKFICRGTVEERIDEMIERKKDLAERILSSRESGEGWITELSNKELREIFTLKPTGREE